MGSPPRPEQIVAELEARLRTERQVDLSLGALRAHVAEVPPVDGLREVRRKLAQRASDLTAALADLAATVQHLREVEQVLRFTEMGWPDRQDELVRMFQADPVVGLTEWLDDWFTAVADARFDAAQRLLSIADHLPAGTETLRRRCRAATLAVTVIDAGQPPLLLEAGAVGIDGPGG